MNYSVGFSEVLVQSGEYALTSEPDSVDAQRAALYLALLSSELTLKFLLERAGMPLKKIRGMSHRLSEILTEIGKCTVEIEVAPAVFRRVSASRVRAIAINHGQAKSTVGRLLCLEANGASQYPNEIRYGDRLVHAPAGAMLLVAAELLRWAQGEGVSISLP